MNNQLIDRIYESALVPELWPDVLDELARLPFQAERSWMVGQHGAGHAHKRQYRFHGRT